jgi:hypothetical protein
MNGHDMTVSETRPLNELECAIVGEFVELMSQEVIPDVIRTMEERDRATIRQSQVPQ